MKLENLKKYKIPDSPGVYFFKKGKEILYIGKATSLRDRVRSYFPSTTLGTGRLLGSRGPAILDMVYQMTSIKWQKTNSVLEALILEANLIKKHQPKYNIKEKDDKSWNYVCLTNEKIPKVILKRGKELEKIQTNNFSAVFGPFPNGLQLREAMKIIRRIFPYFDEQSNKKQNTIFYRQLELTPDNLLQYKKNVVNLKLFFLGKKKKILNNLKKEMLALAKEHRFEQASEIKKRIFALEHIQDIALIKEDRMNPEVDFGDARNGRALYLTKTHFRVEAYDVAHMSGKNMVGVMTVVENGQIAKEEYRKFIIRTQKGANDAGALAEVLTRRLKHYEWPLPDLITVDGNIIQVNSSRKILLQHKLKIPIVGVVKNEKHKPKAILGDEIIVKKHKKEILLANAEAHRFAIKFYRFKSRKNMLTR